MHVGVPREIKSDEHRVGLTPVSVRELVHHGHSVTVETGAGNVVQTITATSIDLAAGKRFSSTDEFFDYLVDQFIENQWQGMLGGVVGDWETGGSLDADDLAARFIAAME